MRSKPLAGQRGVQRLVIGEVDLLQREVAILFGQMGQPVALQLDRVIVVHDIHADDAVAARHLSRLDRVMPMKPAAPVTRTRIGDVLRGDVARALAGRAGAANQRGRPRQGGGDPLARRRGWCTRTSGLGGAWEGSAGHAVRPRPPAPPRERADRRARRRRRVGQEGQQRGQGGEALAKLRRAQQAGCGLRPRGRSRARRSTAACPRAPVRLCPGSVAGCARWAWRCPG